MYQNITNELLRNGLAHLTAICARPGDGRVTFAIHIANDLCRQRKRVYFYSDPPSTVFATERLSHHVQILTALPSPATDIPPHAIVIIDHLSAATRTISPCQNNDAKAALLQDFKNLAVEKNVQLVVTDTFRRADEPDDKLPISNAAITLCDHVYILSKKAYWSTEPEDPYAGVPMLRPIK